MSLAAKNNKLMNVEKFDQLYELDMNDPSLKGFVKIQSYYLQQEDQLLPFPLFKQEKKGNAPSCVLPANHPLSADLIKTLKTFDPLIPEHNLKAYQQLFNINPLSMSEEKISSTKRLNLENLSKDNGEIDKRTVLRNYYQEELQHLIASNNFNPLYPKIIHTIEQYSNQTSINVVNAKRLTKKLLTHDSIINQIAALSFLWAINLKIDQTEDISDLICAAFFHQLGKNQLPLSLFKKAQTELSDDEEIAFRKYPLLTEHFLQKGEFIISERCLQITTNHRERADGKGFPRQKKADQLDTLSLILAFASHVIEFCHGHVNGQKYTLQSVLKKIKSKERLAGLDFQFGNIIEESLKNMPL